MNTQPLADDPEVAELETVIDAARTLLDAAVANIKTTNPPTTEDNDPRELEMLSLVIGGAHAINSVASEVATRADMPIGTNSVCLALLVSLRRAGYTNEQAVQGIANTFAKMNGVADTLLRQINKGHN